MCGIAGLVYRHNAVENAPEIVRRMILLQKHRGPDGEGFFDSEGVSLGHCRLAILDLSSAGQQPMKDPDSRYWITFNGEIYNYLELARELEGLGHSFTGHSDTAVLLAAYIQWGTACLQRLRGMFAFAVWDKQENRLFAARDRLGIKPFHYWMGDNGEMAFASEIKALVEFLPERRANKKLAQQFLAWNLLDHEAADTMIEGIHRLPPAHFIHWKQGEPLEPQGYWDVEVNTALETPRELQGELIAEFKHRLEESIALHLRSDVAVGTCLSGGLDSSAIVCLINSALAGNSQSGDSLQHTFSACFGNPRLDERPFIDEAVRATNCQSHLVFPNGERFREELETWLWHQEEPVASTGSYAQYCVARLAQEQGVKVLLDGQGADEQLAGYRKFILIYLRQLVREGHRARAVREAFPFLSSRGVLKTSRLVDGRRYLFKTSTEASELWPGVQAPEKPSDMGIGASLAGRIETDLKHFSLPILLRYEDRNTMAFGVESRVPFVDHELVEWLAKLPADMRIRGGWTKFIMREALQGVLPEAIRQRKSKLGFSTPEPEWLAGPLAKWLKETLSTATHLEEFVDMNGVRTLLQRYGAGDKSLALQNMLFRLAIFEAWCRQYLEGSRRALSSAAHRQVEVASAAS